MRRWRTGLLALGGTAALIGCGSTGEGSGERTEALGGVQQALTKSKPDDKAHPQVVGLVVPVSAAVGCTASLISSRVLLTAAHCALSINAPNAPLSEDPEDFRFQLENLDDAKRPTFLASVPTPQGFSPGILKPSEVLIHPSYKASRSAAHDVMLLVLPHPIPRSVMKPLRVSSGYGSGPTFWKGYYPRVFGVGPTDDACQGQAGVPVRYLDSAKVKEPGTAFHFVNGGEDGRICFGDSGGPFLTREAQNQSHPGETLSDDMVISLVSQTLDGGFGDEVGPILESAAIRPWLVMNALDRDGDGIESYRDKCDEVAEPAPNQPLADRDNDDIGDACDPCPDDPNNADTDGDRILDCLDECPDDPFHTDQDGDGVATCADPCPKDGKLNANDKWGDADFDGVCNDADNCPLMANPSQDNPNLRSELAQGADPLGSRCEPVPVPDAIPVTSIVDDASAPVPCVYPQCRGLTPEDQAFVYCGTMRRNAFLMRPLRSQHKTNPNLFQNVLGVGTVGRFCQIGGNGDVNGDDNDFTCAAPLIDIQDERLDDAECFQGCAKPEKKGTRFHRITFSQGGNADPDGPPVPLDYTVAYNDPNPTSLWVWNYEADYQRWITAGLIDVMLFSGGPSKLRGNLWFHANTKVGANSNIADLGFFHGDALANWHWLSILDNFKDESGVYPEEHRCYKCFRLSIPDDLAWSGASGSKAPPAPYFVWRPSPKGSASSFQRFDAEPSEASLVVLGAGGLPAAVRTLESACDGEILDGRSGNELQKRLSDLSVVWSSAADPFVAQGAEEAFPLAVALSTTTADVVDTVHDVSGALLSDADRAAPRLLGVSAPGVTRFASVLSRARRGVYVLGGEDPKTGALSGKIWFRSLEGRVWKVLPSGDYRPERVLAATYSVATDKLYVLDERADGTARLASVDGRSGAAKTLGAWARHPSWDLHWLVADREGALLFASANRSAKRHAVAQIDVTSGAPAVVRRLEGDRALVLPPLVDAAGYTLVLRRAAHGQAIDVARLRALSFSSARFSSLGQQL